MARAVIVCGAEINNYERARDSITPGDFIVFCDCGLAHVEGLKVTPDLIVGDFDSYENPEFYGHVADDGKHQQSDDADARSVTFDPNELGKKYDCEIIALPREKDDTDSMYAIKECIKRGFDELVILGAIGGRMDHTLVNLYALKFIYDSGVKASIIDDYEQITLLGPSDTTYISREFAYFSLIAIAGEAQGVTIKNAKYNLDNGTITPAYQYASSNEVAEGCESACVTLKSGVLAVICVSG